MEQFPLYSTREEMEEYIEQLKRDLESQEHDKRVLGLAELSKTEIGDKENFLEKMRKSQKTKYNLLTLRTILNRLTMGSNT